MLKTPKTYTYIFSASILCVTHVKLWVTALETENEVVEIPIKPQVIRHEVFTDIGFIKLKCNILKHSFKKNRIMSINELRWESKKCGYGLHLTSCANYHSIPWTPVLCKNDSKFCDGNALKLDNPTPSDSGYYRCLYKNYMSKQFKVRKTFYLDVYDPENSFEILDEPFHYDNRVVHVNDTVTFRCRARSLFPLHMMWVKLIPSENKRDRLVQYGIHTYELLNSSGAHNVGHDLYISKLTIPKCQVSDSGRYHCVIISVNDAHLVKNKTISLMVVPKVQNEGDVLRSCVALLLLFQWIYMFHYALL